MLFYFLVISNVFFQALTSMMKTQIIIIDPCYHQYFPDQIRFDWQMVRIAYHFAMDNFFLQLIDTVGVKVRKAR